VENSKIGWCHHTFNPWVGCSKVSPACDNCYAERDMDHRFGRVTWGPGQERDRTKEGNWSKPRRWNREAAAEGTKYKVFCASLADVFDGEKVSDLDAWRADLWKLIEETESLYWLLLTKRPQNIMRMVPESWRGGFPEHVWIGASAESQEWLDRRASILCQVPATVRFLSCEPLLGPLNMEHYLFANDAFDGSPVPNPRINWVIAGGESGKDWRPMDMDWVRGIRDQCVAADVPFFFKQTAGMHPIKEPELDGRQWMECPETRFSAAA